MTTFKTGLVIFAISLALSALGAAGPTAAQAATCSEFPNQAAAQEAANTSDPDSDGIYCESLPCPCSPEWHAQHEPESPPESKGLPPVKGSTKAPPPGSLPSQVWPLRDRRGLHRSLRRVPQRLLAKARHFIRRVRTAAKGASSGYSREEFGTSWTDSAVNIPWAGNGCDTRNDILRRDLTGVRFRPETGECIVESGRLRNPYLGTTILFSKSDAGAVPIDHVVALSLAWQMGARSWSKERRVQIANDPLNLLAVDRSSNSAKGDSGPSEWLPPNGAIRCAYSVRFAQVARKYELPVTRVDKRTMLGQCRSPAPILVRSK